MSAHDSKCPALRGSSIIDSNCTCGAVGQLPVEKPDTPLGALRAALTEHDLAYDPELLDRDRDYYERMQARLAEARRNGERRVEPVSAHNHPPHYGGKDNVYEAIKVIEHYKLGFALGNTIKYIIRHDKKGSPLEDLKKAAWYLNYEIQKLEQP